MSKWIPFTIKAPAAFEEILISVIWEPRYGEVEVVTGWQTESGNFRSWKFVSKANPDGAFPRGAEPYSWHPMPLGDPELFKEQKKRHETKKKQRQAVDKSKRQRREQK